jgi:hypothetical protein
VAKGRNDVESVLRGVASFMLQSPWWDFPRGGGAEGSGLIQRYWMIWPFVLLL